MGERGILGNLKSKVLNNFNFPGGILGKLKSKFLNNFHFQRGILGKLKSTILNNFHWGVILDKLKSTVLNNFHWGGYSWQAKIHNPKQFLFPRDILGKLKFKFLNNFHLEGYSWQGQIQSPEQFNKPPAELFPVLSGAMPVEQKKSLKLWMGEQSLNSIPASSRQSGGLVSSAVKLRKSTRVRILQ